VTAAATTTGAQPRKEKKIRLSLLIGDAERRPETRRVVVRRVL